MKLWAKKSLGQHFLNSAHVLEQIIDAAHIKKDEVVLEIGPGTGVLTSALLKAGAKVVAVEKDDRALGLIKEKFAAECATGNLFLTQGDILDENTFKSNQSPLTNASNGSYALVANIPYYITGAILEKFLEHEPRPNRMVLLVQREVAERIVARPADGEDRGKESILSISVKAFGTPKIVARVPRGAFTPPPTVDSAILSIENISDAYFKEGNIDIRDFFEAVRAGFAHKRKFLKRNLEAVMHSDQLEAVWKRSGLNDKIRAEDAALEQWFHLLSP